jgi:hypothetical protein
MRLTVGPLPPAVYWRRRAVVLGAALLFLIVVLYSCVGSGKSGAAPESTKSPKPPAPTGSVLTPETGAPPTSEPPEPTPTTEQVTQEQPPAGDGGCTDEELSVIPVPSQTTAKRGVTIELRLKIKNVSKRACSRDLGALAQELYIKLGARKVWSSDTCNPSRDSNVQSLKPNIEHEYRVSWNGRADTKCASGLASGPYPDPGEYQLFGRLGTKLSEPVKVTITG